MNAREFHSGATPESDAFFERHPRFPAAFACLMQLANRGFGREYHVFGELDSFVTYAARTIAQWTACRRKHPKTSGRPSVSRPSRKRVFGQGEAAPRAGLYARVSTHDQQTLPMQLAAMRDYARKRSWQIAFEVKDVGSGAALRQKREELLGAARRREIDLGVVWRLDRWG